MSIADIPGKTNGESLSNYHEDLLDIIHQNIRKFSTKLIFQIGKNNKYTENSTINSIRITYIYCIYVPQMSNANKKSLNVELITYRRIHNC